MCSAKIVSGGSADTQIFVWYMNLQMIWGKPISKKRKGGEAFPEIIPIIIAKTPALNNSQIA